ncbi:MAG: 4-alpha-glucanotransferase [Nitrospinae bacterium]|nr:4-alpha-glucanotransferase [Nitrospinota bacterium]
MKYPRQSGILLHVTCLPSKFGVGDMGPEAYRFVDFLNQAGQKVWQVLPLNPTTVGDSPYFSPSAFAGNFLLVSPEKMVEEGWLQASDIELDHSFSDEKVAFGEVGKLKRRYLKTAFERASNLNDNYENFCNENSFWLEDYSLFMALKEFYGGAAWVDWPPEIRGREEHSVIKFKEQLQQDINFEKFVQYIFFEQWKNLKEYCNDQGIKIFGDLPIYVTHDSSDVWANPEIFKLDDKGNPLVVAGVPPDYFSKTGQLWGNPVYDWDALKRDAYNWWMERIRFTLGIMDVMRIDHFRGFIAAWEVPAGEKTAEKGCWFSVPGAEFFPGVLEEFPNAFIVAEDLGVITDEVRDLMRDCDFLGMKILVFAFDSDLKTNPYLPHNHSENSVVYTGTHDCNTVRGWFENDLTKQQKKNLFKYLGKEISAEEVSGELIKQALMSPSYLSILPMQDVLGLEESARFNFPGTTKSNWEWRLLKSSLTRELADHLSFLVDEFGRRG